MNKKLLAGLAAVGLLAGGASAPALAAAGAPAAAVSTAAVSSASRVLYCGPLESLVTKGTITQAQATAIRDAFVSYVRAHWPSVLDTVLGQLVASHTITQAQANAVTTEITQWVQKYHGNGSGHQSPCLHNHGPGMMGGPRE